MSYWYIEVNGTKQYFTNWEEALRLWEEVKRAPKETYDAVFVRRQFGGGSDITLDCA